MTFEEWWEESARRYDVPAETPFLDIGKLVAEVAWGVGFAEGRREWRRSTEEETSGNDTKAGSKTAKNYRRVL